MGRLGANNVAPSFPAQRRPHRSPSSIRHALVSKRRPDDAADARRCPRATSHRACQPHMSATTGHRAPYLLQHLVQVGRIIRIVADGFACARARGDGGGAAVHSPGHAFMVHGPHTRMGPAAHTRTSMHTACAHTPLCFSCGCVHAQQRALAPSKDARRATMICSTLRSARRHAAPSACLTAPATAGAPTRRAAPPTSSWRTQQRQQQQRVVCRSTGIDAAPAYMTVRCHALWAVVCA